VVLAVSRVEGMISPIQTVAPRVRSIEAVARPMPLAPPVMAITLEFIDISGGFDKWLRGESGW